MLKDDVLHNVCDFKHILHSGKNVILLLRNAFSKFSNIVMNKILLKSLFSTTLLGSLFLLL